MSIKLYFGLRIRVELVILLKSSLWDDYFCKLGILFARYRFESQATLITLIRKKAGISLF